MPPSLSSLPGRIGKHLTGTARRPSRALEAGVAAGEPGSGSRTRLLRTLLGGIGGGRSPGGRGRKDDSDLRLGTKLAVLGRAALFALATLAGTADPGGNARRNGDSETDPAEGDAGEGTVTFGRRVRESGPAVLVPLAWSFAIAAHLGALEERTVLVAHLVMDCILVAFAAASWSEMEEGVLRAWRLVLLVGLWFTLLGTAALLRTDDSSSSETEAEAIEETTSTRERALALTVQAWLLVPAAGLAYTGFRVGEDEAPRVYLAGAVLSALGSLAYASAPTDSPAAPRKLLGLALANVGQTAGIANAVYQY